MTKRLALALLLAVACFALTACEVFGDKDKEALNRPCAGAAAQIHPSGPLPGGFPDAPGIRYTAVQKHGPTTIASGFIDTTIGPAHQAYAKAIRNAKGYSVTKEEQDAADSEVNFAGNGTSGQVTMVQECKSRTNVTITIRPA